MRNTTSIIATLISCGTESRMPLTTCSEHQMRAFSAARCSFPTVGLPAFLSSGMRLTARNGRNVRKSLRKENPAHRLRREEVTLAHQRVHARKEMPAPTPATSMRPVTTTTKSSLLGGGHRFSQG